MRLPSSVVVGPRGQSFGSIAMLYVCVYVCLLVYIVLYSIVNSYTVKTLKNDQQVLLQWLCDPPFSLSKLPNLIIFLNT